MSDFSIQGSATYVQVVPFRSLPWRWHLQSYQNAGTASTYEVVKLRKPQFCIKHRPQKP